MVKNALLKHLDMDPPATLGVLCDQIILPPELLDADERATRAHLRTLVLAFLGGQARSSVIRNASNPTSEAVLVDGILAALPELDTAHVEKITRGLLFALPVFSKPSSRGADLLNLLIAKAAPIIKSEPTKVQPARLFLELASDLALERHATSPRDLLAFLCTNFKSLLRPDLPKDDSIFFVNCVAIVVDATEDEALRSQVVTAAPMMVKVTRR